MSTISPRFEINGVIDTKQNVMQNLNTLATACGAWITYDITNGTWSPIINGPGSSVAMFNDTNIIGGINVSGSSINELYNSVSIEFPHRDLRDQTDYIDFEIPNSERYPYELDNKLQISLDCVNDPIQAAYIAASELKQSRIDKIIEFTTDYSKLGIRAGDLISVTTAIYGWVNKIFRVISMTEADEQGININIKALEYSEDVYSTSGLIRKERSKKTGIVPKDANEALTQSDSEKTGNDLNRALAVCSTEPGASTDFCQNFFRLLSGQGLQPVVYSFATGQINLDETLESTSDQDFFAAFTAADSYPTGYSTTIPYTGRYVVDYFFNFGVFSGYDGSGNFISPENLRKRVRPIVKLNGSEADLGTLATTTAGKGDDPFTDLAIASAPFTAVKGQSAVFEFYARNTMGPNNPGVISKGGFATACGIVWISGKLIYLGA